MREARADGSFSVFNKQLVGLWNSVDQSGWRSVTSLNADGTCSEGEKRYGTWEADRDHLVIHFDAQPTAKDTYDLPVREGVLKGKTAKGDALKLTLRSTTAAAEVYAALSGTWEFANANDGHRATVILTPKGTVTENGQRIGYWVVEDNRLLYSFTERHNFIDVYGLPAKEGVLGGRNSLNHQLTLSRQKIDAPVLAAATPNAGATGGGGGVLPDASYFGARDAGTVPDSRAAGTPLPRLATPPPAVAQVGSFAGGSARSAAADTSGGGSVATPSVAPTVAVATPASAARTPVGKWHWHAGPDKRLTDKGAILEESRVVGQWRWLDQPKAKIEVRWTGGGRRAPMNYTVSEHGNHLVGTSPESGNEHSEERVE